MKGVIPTPDTVQIFKMTLDIDAKCADPRGGLKSTLDIRLKFGLNVECRLKNWNCVGCQNYPLHGS